LLGGVDPATTWTTVCKEGRSIDIDIDSNVEYSAFTSEMEVRAGDGVAEIAALQL
jgi:hypothetical protein